jgi:hypothetical protein
MLTIIFKAKSRSILNRKRQFFTTIFRWKYIFKLYHRFQVYHHLSRDPDGRATAASGRACQARRLRGHQGRHEVHQRQVIAAAAPSPLGFPTVLFNRKYI